MRSWSLVSAAVRPASAGFTPFHTQEPNQAGVRVISESGPSETVYDLICSLGCTGRINVPGLEYIQ